MSSSKLLYKMKSILVVTSSASLLSGCYCYFKNDERFFKNIVMPTIQLFDAENAHHLGVKICSNKYLLPFNEFIDPESLNTRISNLALKNCIGMAAGFDKNAEGVVGLHHLGFGFVEIGSVTPFPQEGNPRPRVFRLSEDEGIINRYGFNSEGHEKVYERLVSFRHLESDESKAIVGVNLGKNKNSEDPVRDYCDGVRKFSDVADYLVINVSSPNTPGLRKMQEKKVLRQLLSEVIKARNSVDTPKPIFLKLSPDLSKDEMSDICSIIQTKECKIDGLIISNTTTDRSLELHSKHSNESGGLSGRPLKEKSLKMVEDVYKLTQGQIPIIGVGGVSNGQDAFDFILSGASAVQLYTSFVFHGPPLVNKIKRELDEKLKENGYDSVSEARGKGVSISKRHWFYFF